MQVDSELPVYASETRYFREILGREFGSHLRRIGLLRPDAACSDGTSLYLLDCHAIRQTQARIRDYRRNRVRITHNLPPLCHA